MVSRELNSLLILLGSSGDVVGRRRGRRDEAGLLLTVELGVDHGDLLVGGSVEVLVDARAADRHALWVGELAAKSRALSQHLGGHRGLLVCIVEEADPDLSALRGTFPTTLRKL